MSNDLLETDADKLFNLVKKEKKIRAVEAAKKLDMDTEKAISLAEILEEDELIELHYPPIGEPLFIFKDETTKKIEKEKKEEKKHKPKSGQIKLLGVVVAIIFLFITISYKNNPQMFSRFSFDSLSEFYLDMNTILIIATVFTVIIVLIILMALRTRKKKLKVKGKADESKKTKEKEDKKGREKPKPKGRGWKIFGGRKKKKRKPKKESKKPAGKKK